VHYTYVLLSQREANWYIGAGRAQSTSPRCPLSLGCAEACLSADDAYRRQRYLKSGRGGRHLRARLASSLAELSANKLERH
jgi:hypothetical protein